MTLSTMRHWSDMSRTIATIESSFGRTSDGPNIIARLRASICKQHAHQSAQSQYHIDISQDISYVSQIRPDFSSKTLCQSHIWSECDPDQPQTKAVHLHCKMRYWEKFGENPSERNTDTTDAWTHIHCVRWKMDPLDIMQ